MHFKSAKIRFSKLVYASLASCILFSGLPSAVNPAVIIAQAEEVENTDSAVDASAYSAVYNYNYYYAHNPDLVSAFGTDKDAYFNHFYNYGMMEGRQGNSEFNVFTYKETYADLRAVFGEDLKLYYQHYVDFGKAEGRTANSKSGKAGVQTPITTPFAPSSTATNGAGTSAALDTSSFEAFKAGYFGRSVFIGDSVMTGFRNYSEYTETANTHSSKFLANVGFALYNSTNAVTSSSKHPTYQGKKDYVWNNITLMDVDRAFIMFGANELVSFAPDTVIPTYYIPFIQKILEAKPGIEINVISMPPVYAGTNKGHLNQSNVNSYNQLIKEMCAANGWHYIDITAKMKDSNGNMVAAYSSDKYVHMNNKGYAEAWEPALDAYANSVYSQLGH